MNTRRPRMDELTDTRGLGGGAGRGSTLGGRGEAKRPYQDVPGLVGGSQGSKGDLTPPELFCPRLIGLSAVCRPTCMFNSILGHL